ncbi:MAG: hypothetical protein O9267_00870 [Flavobacterium sp.]|uniref:hypothetical protein n=1 Tax=Flavobacterium sp. TaxID=239 RepID=UPI0022C2334C|nr:hypothetical protein [Flavobacterium sp.]MCZ8196140.1 hypothetical protein [Flavobacterium sp.]
MKFKLYSLFLLFTFLFSCQQDDAKSKAEKLKDIKKKEAVFYAINDAWFFDIPEMTEKARVITNNWSELRLFVTELDQKPTSSIGAFQKKAKILSKKVAELNNNIPAEFNTTPVRSRIAILNTKINSLNLYINLRDIPVKKVEKILAEINVELYWFYEQMEEIIIRSEIPAEDGEPDFMLMKDSTRAIPTDAKIINSPDLE